MRGVTCLRLTFLAAAVLQVATIYLDHRLVPYCGTIAMSALLAMALLSPGPDPGRRRWTHHTALSGLFLLTAAAVLADRRTGGFGWSTDVAGGDSFSIRFGMPGSGPLVVEAVVVVAGAAALAVAVLGRAGRLLRWRHLPGAAVGLLYLVAVADISLHPPMLFSDMIAPDLGLLLLVLMPVAGVLAALFLAANAAVASRGPLRPAGAGLLAVVALALTGFHSLSETGALQPHADPAANRYRVEDMVATFDRSDLIAAVDEQSRRGAGSVPAHSGQPALSGDRAASGARAESAEELNAEYYRELPPPASPEEARARMLSQDASRESGVVGVPYPPSWNGGEIDWERNRPAIKAALIAAGLMALVMALFQPARRFPSGN